MAQLLPKGVDEHSPDPLKLNTEELEREWALPADRNQREDHVDDSKNGHHGKNSVLHKFKDKAKRLKDKVKKNITGHHESSGEEEESEKEQDDSPKESDENAEAVRRALAGLGTFGTRDILNNHNMPSEETTKANEKQGLQARRDDVSTEETMKGNKVRDIFNRKDDVSKEKTMKANENPNEDLFHYKETEEGRGKRGNAILVTEKEEIETDVDIPSVREKAEAMTENTETMLGLGKGRQQRGGGGDEKPMSSRDKDNVMEAVASVKGHFDAKPEKAEPQKSWGARSYEEVGPSEEKRGDFVAPIGPNSTETMLGRGKGRKHQGGGGEEKPMSSRIKDNVMEAVASVEDHFDAKPEKAEPQKSWGARSSEEVGPAEEKWGYFGAPIGPNSAENSEDKSRSLAPKTQDKVSEHGQGNEVASNEIPPNFTEEIKYGAPIGPNLAKNSEEESQRLAPKTQDKVSERGQGNELASNEIPLNFTEEIKASASELGSKFMSRASQLVQGFKDVVASDQSSKDKKGEALIEEECNENGVKGIQEQQSGAEATGGQSYAQKLYAAKDAIASNLGYGGKNNNFAEQGEKLYGAKDDGASKLGYGGKERNFVEQGEQIEGVSNETGRKAMEGAKEKQETFKGVIVSKLSPGEDEKALFEGTQEQQSGAEATGGQSYAQKLFAAKDAIASNLGYGGKENNFAEQGEKLYAAKDAIASKVGYGGKENNFVEQGEQIQGASNGTGTEAMEGAKEKQETFKGVFVSKLSPGEDEKALSEVITEALNHGAKSVKDSVLGGFSGCNENPKVSSSSTSDGIVEAFHDNDCHNSGNNPLREKGMMDRVTGVASPLLGRIHGEDGDRYPSSDEPEPKSVVGTPETRVMDSSQGRT